MQIYCDKCRAPQNSYERTCSKCGTPFGGEIIYLIIGIIFFLFPALFLFIKDLSILFHIKVFFWFQLPTMVATAFLYDYHPIRRSIYFWGGTATILVSIYIFA